MKKVNLFIIVVGYLLLITGCASRQYEIENIKTSRVGMDRSWDEKAHPEMIALVNSYKDALDNQMNVEIGTATRTMTKGRPQSLLGNFTADALRKRAEALWGNIDFAIVNTGGLRSTLNKGTITIGNMYEIYSFDNTLVLLEVPGDAIRQFFQHIAAIGGQALSDNLELTVKKRKIKELKIGGKALDPAKTYRVATLDYLAEGNDGMDAFTKAVNRVDSKETLRDIMIEYVKQQTLKNKEINAELDRRITIMP